MLPLHFTYDLRFSAAKHIVLRTQPQQEGTLTQPFHCHLQSWVAKLNRITHSGYTYCSSKKVSVGSITHAAAARRNLDTAIPLPSAVTELQNLIELRTAATRPDALCCPEIYRDVPGMLMKMMMMMLMMMMIEDLQWMEEFNWGGRIKPLLKIFNECKSLTGVGELNPYWRSSMNVRV